MVFRSAPTWMLTASALLFAGVGLARPGGAQPPGDAPAVVASASPATADVPVIPAGLDPAPLVADPLAPPAPAALGEAHLDLALGRWVAPLVPAAGAEADGGDAQALLTLDPVLQLRLERALAGWTVPWGAIVMMDPRTGRVLAMAEHSRAEPRRRGLALSAMSPAASIFKIVTAAALLETGVDPDERVCYHGGKRRLQPKVLADDPRRDRRCRTFTAAFGHSTNAVFAKLAGRGLDAAGLRAAAGRWLFNAPIPFARPVEVSEVEVTDDPFDVANTAAGFGKVRMSALHGAVVAATIANGGVLAPPRLVDEVRGGPELPAAEPWRVVEPGVALKLHEMMRATVTEGTGRKAFRRVAPALRGVTVAGKTGSLFEREPFRDHSWFVGYAPADAPEVAFAVVVVNERVWRVRAPSLAREALEIYFGTRVAEADGPARLLRTASR